MLENCLANKRKNSPGSLWKWALTMSRDAGFIVESYSYPAGPEPNSSGWSGLVELDLEGGNEPAAEAIEVFPDESKDPQVQLEIDAELQQRFDAGRQRGYEEGRKAERDAQSAAHLADENRHKEQVAALVENFALVRDRYLQEVEHEVVELSLAVAARILRRESQMDPLLLTGAVRVALGQLAKSTRVTLHVPQSELELWGDAIAHIPNLALKPEVLADDDMRLGDCRIETELGSVDLGIRAQLGEIERGFFDRAPRAGADLHPPQTRSNEPRISS